MLAHGLHEQGAGHDQRLLVGQQDTLAPARRLQRGQQAGGPDNGSHDVVDLVQSRDLHQPCRSLQHLHFRRSLAQPVGEPLRGIGIDHGGKPGAKAQTLFGQLGVAGIGGQRNDPEPVRVARHDIECIHADRAGCTQHGDTRCSTHDRHTRAAGGVARRCGKTFSFIAPAT
jgi:hypothetical protein